MFDMNNMEVKKGFNIYNHKVRFIISTMVLSSKNILVIGQLNLLK